MCVAHLVQSGKRTVARHGALIAKFPSSNIWTAINGEYNLFQQLLRAVNPAADQDGPFSPSLHLPSWSLYVGRINAQSISTVRNKSGQPALQDGIKPRGRYIMPQWREMMSLEPSRWLETFTSTSPLTKTACRRQQTKLALSSYPTDQ